MSAQPVSSFPAIALSPLSLQSAVNPRRGWHSVPRLTALTVGLSTPVLAALLTLPASAQALEISQPLALPPTQPASPIAPPAKAVSALPMGETPETVAPISAPVYARTSGQTLDQTSGQTLDQTLDQTSGQISVPSGELLEAAQPISNEAAAEEAIAAAAIADDLETANGAPTQVLDSLTGEAPAALPGVVAAPVADSIPDLLTTLLGTPDPTVQEATAQTLAEVGEAAVPELSAVLESDSAQARAIAAFTLAEMGNSAEAAAPALLSALEDDNELVRAFATQALANVGLARPALIEVLVSAIENEPDLVRDIAADALVKIGSEAVPALGEVLANETTSQAAKATAAALISNIGRASDLGEVALQVALPTLTEALNSQDAMTQVYAADTLWTLTEDPDLVVPTLISVAASSDHKARDLATVGLGYLAREVLPQGPLSVANLVNEILGSPSQPRTFADSALGLVENHSRPNSTLGMIARQARRFSRVPAIIRAVTQLWR